MIARPAPNGEARRAPPSPSPYVALAAVVVAVTIAKLAILRSGADYDGDAYAHAMAGRRLLLDPGDVTIHWVWLPFLHVLAALATASGSGIEALRVLNVLASGAAPFLLARLLDRAPSDVYTSNVYTTEVYTSPPGAQDLPRRARIACLAGALLALDPLCVWLGVTGQTEPLFQLLVLGALLAFEGRAFVIAGALFALAALTRYEMWPVVPALFAGTLLVRGEGVAGGGREPGVAGSQAAARWRALPRLRRPFSLRRQAVWALPGAAIVAWCAFHFRATGEPLQFLRLNREFASGFLAGVGYPWGKEPIVPLMLVLYVTVIPVWNMLGAAWLLAPFGLRPALRELPRSFTVTSIALLAVVTWGLLRGTHLGLPRHAVALAPFYCALVAHGAWWLGERLAARRRAPLVAAPLAVLALVVATRTAPKLVELGRVTARAFAEEAAAARALREAARPGEPIFCDDGKIEVLSQLDPRRFNRWQIVDVAPFHLAKAVADHGSALVVSTPARAAHLAGGEVVWRDGTRVVLRF